MAQAKTNYGMTVHPTAGLVRSQSDGARAHQVTLSSCDCADYINRKGQLVEVGDALAVTVCKHIAEFLTKVGGWSRQPEPTVVYRNLLHNDVRELLRGDVVGFSLRESNQVLAEVGRTGSVSFKASLTGLRVDGTLEYDGLTSRYTLTVIH